MNSTEIIRSQFEAYQSNFLNHGDNPKGTFWNDRETQYLRYKRIILPFNLKKNNYSIYDIGSGMCDLHQYLTDQKIKHQYSGIEIVPEMIVASKQKFPAIEVHNWDILKEQNIPKADITMLSGTLNLHSGIPHEEWKAFAFALIKRMFEISKVGISFNMLTSHRTFTDPTLAYFDPTEVFEFCMKNLGRFVVIDHAYPLFEFTVSVFHKDFMRAEFSEEAYKKYLK